jgi:hypothetical protein
MYNIGLDRRFRGVLPYNRMEYCFHERNDKWFGISGTGK